MYASRVSGPSDDAAMSASDEGKDFHGRTIGVLGAHGDVQISPSRPLLTSSGFRCPLQLILSLYIERALSYPNLFFREML